MSPEELLQFLHECSTGQRPSEQALPAIKAAMIRHAGTPSSKWRAAGEPDPHAGHYDGERAALCMGKLTDDELANGAFMNYDVRPPLQDIIDGKAFSPIAWMTAVKDRIRWLSRRLDRATNPPPDAEQAGQSPLGYVSQATAKAMIEGAANGASLYRKPTDDHSVAVFVAKAPEAWQWCRTHGPAAPNTWGCPACVAELRKENHRLQELANRSEKWKGVASAKFGDGRTVQMIEEEAVATYRAQQPEVITTQTDIDESRSTVVKVAMALALDPDRATPEEVITAAVLAQRGTERYEIARNRRPGLMLDMLSGRAQPSERLAKDLDHNLDSIIRMKKGRK